MSRLHIRLLPGKWWVCRILHCKDKGGERNEKIQLNQFKVPVICQNMYTANWICKICYIAPTPVSALDDAVYGGCFMILNLNNTLVSCLLILPGLVLLAMHWSAEFWWLMMDVISLWSHWEGLLFDQEKSPLLLYLTTWGNSICFPSKTVAGEAFCCISRLRTVNKGVDTDCKHWYFSLLLIIPSSQVPL